MGSGRGGMVPQEPGGKNMRGGHYICLLHLASRSFLWPRHGQQGVQDAKAGIPISQEPRNTTVKHAIVGATRIREPAGERAQIWNTFHDSPGKHVLICTFNHTFDDTFEHSLTNQHKS